MTHFTPTSFLFKKEVLGFYLHQPFQLATTPGFHVTHTPTTRYFFVFVSLVLICFFRPLEPSIYPGITLQRTCMSCVPHSDPYTELL